MAPIVPPIKCQGIKTKIVPIIKQLVDQKIEGYWIEPFCGSCVVALNIQAQRARLSDTNIHIINLYRAIQDGTISAGKAKKFLESEGDKLVRIGEKYYYEVRDRFNATGNSFDFLFLNRSCFNGVMRFNRKGKFNVPFGHKPERFRQAYITKITNQIKAFSNILKGKDWTFEVQGFENSLAFATERDFVYADPPYMGRHVDYFNSWTEEDEIRLTKSLKSLPSHFLLSTWHSNKYRTNISISECWNKPPFEMVTVEHFYHVGSTEDLRNSMKEAVIANYSLPVIAEKETVLEQNTLEI